MIRQRLAVILGCLISSVACVSFVSCVWGVAALWEIKALCGTFRVYVLYVNVLIYCDIVNADVVT